jgi:hypothetical protein
MMTMTKLATGFLIVAWLAACGSQDSAGDPGGDPPGDESDAARPAGDVRPAFGAESNVDDDRDPVVPPPTTGVCQVGTSEPCVCPQGTMGSRVCVSESGERSACGCLSASGPDILVPPPPPRINKCGAKTCAPFAEPDTEVSARHCCTAAGDCGASSSFIFGQACVPRGGLEGGFDAVCPDEFPSFLDLYGCCRPDGACGLSIDHVANFDVGCVARPDMAKLLNEGSRDRDILSLFFLLPIKKAEYAPIRCTPK